MRIFTFGACCFAMIRISACGIGDADLYSIDPASIPPAINYVAHIEPIMAKHCVSCHSDHVSGGARSGVNLTEYEGVKASIIGIAETVENGTMPPGVARRMTAWETMILLKWVDNPLQRP